MNLTSKRLQMLLNLEAGGILLEIKSMIYLGKLGKNENIFYTKAPSLFWRLKQKFFPLQMDTQIFIHF